MLCFRKILEAKILWIRGGEYQAFPSVYFCLRLPKSFLWEPLFVSQNFRYRKMSGIRDGVIHDFPSKAFLSQSAEKIHRGTLLCCVSENGKLLVAKKFMNNRGGGIRNFR